jgi:hypothetical protein
LRCGFDTRRWFGESSTVDLPEPNEYAVDIRLGDKKEQLAAYVADVVYPTPESGRIDYRNAAMDALA